MYIQCEYNGEKNMVAVFATHNLYSKYNFSTGEYSDEILSSGTLESFKNKEFHLITDKQGDTIIELCRKYQKNKDEHTYNVFVSQRGELFLGNHLVYVQNRLGEYSSEWEEAKQELVFNELEIVIGV